MVLASPKQGKIKKQSNQRGTRSFHKVFKKALTPSYYLQQLLLRTATKKGQGRQEAYKNFKKTKREQKKKLFLKKKKQIFVTFFFSKRLKEKHSLTFFKETVVFFLFFSFFKKKYAFLASFKRKPSKKVGFLGLAILAWLIFE